MIRMRTTAAPLLAAALMTADAAAQGRVVQLPERDRVLSGAAPQVYAVGAAEGAEHEIFGEIAGVAFDAADNLYVLDRPNARVMVYGPNGRFIRQIGRKGQGPGELTVPMQLAIAGDGTVVVMDLARPAYSLFRPDGTFIRNVAMEGVMPLGTQMAWHPRGGVVGTFRAAPADNPRTGTHTETTIPLTFHPFGGGNPVRLYQIPQQWTTQSSSSGPGQMQIRMSPPPTFSPAVLFGVLPGGQMALSFTSGYTVRILDANGQTVRYLQRPLPVRRTTERDRERARAQRREMMESGRGRVTITTGGGGGRAPRGAPGGAEIERMLGEMRFADTIAALRGLRVAPSGKLWVERTPAFGAEDGPVDLLTPEGQYLGTINGLGLPAAISRGGLAAFTEVDDLGVDRVVVRRLPQPWR